MRVSRSSRGALERVDRLDVAAQLLEERATDGVGVGGSVDVRVQEREPGGRASWSFYFRYQGPGEMPLPDTSLTTSTIDGGVIFANLTPGDYTVTASKAGMSFTPVLVRCREGFLVNAAPPHGIQQL